jgi:hypothetical protein
MSEALTVLRIPAINRRRLRTTNNLKRLDKEIKRGTRAATLVPNEASPLRLASAVLSEISDAWETDRAYLTWKPDDPPLKNCALQKRCCFVAARSRLSTLAMEAMANENHFARLSYACLAMPIATGRTASAFLS